MVSKTLNMPNKGVMVDHSILVNEKRILSLNNHNSSKVNQSRSQVGQALLFQGGSETEKLNKPISLLAQGTATLNNLQIQL